MPVKSITTVRQLQYPHYWKGGARGGFVIKLIRRGPCGDVWGLEAELNITGGKGRAVVIGKEE